MALLCGNTLNLYQVKTYRAAGRPAAFDLCIFLDIIHKSFTVLFEIYLMWCWLHPGFVFLFFFKNNP